MKTVELFAGTGSFSKIAKERGHSIYRVEYDKQFDAEKHFDLSQPFPFHLNAEISEADIVWMSPPCTTFSLASGNTHWDVNRQPKTKEAIKGLKLLNVCKEIAEYCEKSNKIFFIENPNGRAVWFLPERWLKRVWYCQYGDTRAKPTNIWTNLDIEFKTCKNGNKNCHHERAPRGSKTGTQGLKGAKDRSRIPPKLFEYIFNIIDYTL